MPMNKLPHYFIRGIFSLIILYIGSIGYAQELYVGANYHPHDSKSGDLDPRHSTDATGRESASCGWDTLPGTATSQRTGSFDFAWFDQVMDKMNAAGIKVILDVAVHPAPLWLHHKYPSIDVVDPNGKPPIPQPPLHGRRGRS
jgi:beta-galactosidase